MAVPWLIKSTKCLEIVAISCDFQASKLLFRPSVSRTSRSLHNSPCRDRRNYDFIPPYSKLEPVRDEPRTEVIESKEDFKYVERLIPPVQVPPVPHHEQYPTPSGWSPPKGATPDTPYNVTRTRFHNFPVFTDTRKSNQHWTHIKNIRGDIWALAEDLKSYLEKEAEKGVPVTVNEYAMNVRYKGLYEEKVKQWLSDKGF